MAPNPWPYDRSDLGRQHPLRGPRGAQGPIPKSKLRKGEFLHSGGFCFAPTYELVARGGWAAIAVDEGGHFVRGTFRNLWGPQLVLQPAVFAEAYALRSGLQHLEETEDGDLDP